MKVIHDNVWGDIEISPLAQSVIDTPEFQRLRYIKQTGCAYLVFPSAQTTRFEHCIGTYHVTGLLLEHLFRNQPNLRCDIVYDTELIKIAALCHDIGHGPFSHTFDKVLSESHEIRSQNVTREILRRIGMSHWDIGFVVSIIDPLKSVKQPWYMSLIKNKNHGIDTDKFDYILRDNLAFGLKLNVDVNRVITNTRVINNELCFCDRIKDDLFNIYFIRYRLHKEIYSHPTILAYDLLLQEIIRLTCSKFSLDHTDASILSSCPDQQLVNMFLRRQNKWKQTTLDGDGVVKVNVTPSFLSDGVTTHPLSKIKYFFRKSPSESRSLELSEYNIFVSGSTGETITYTFECTK